MANDYPDWSTQQSYASTLIDTLLFSGGGGPFVYDVSQFASLTLSISGNTGASSISVICTNGSQTQTQNLTANANQACQITIPVNFSSITVLDPTGNSHCNVVISGSNRPVNGLSVFGNSFLPRVLFFSGPLVAFTPIVLPSADGAPSYTTLNGQCTVTAQCSSGAADMYMSWVARNGNVEQQPIGHIAAANSAVQFSINHPACPVTWLMNPFTASGAGSAQATIIPAAGV